MQIDLSKTISPNDTVAVATSGGADSMALLYYMHNAAKNSTFKVIALNVEHGIRGETSRRDTEFVKNYCNKHGITLLCYAVNSLEKAEEEKLSVEEAARKLRYDCFNDAVTKGACNKIATAHHQGDNAESVLFNLFRGTGLKGVSGITENFGEKIIRPMLDVSKEEILDYIKDNEIPFVTDETNLSSEYSRNFIRLNVMPKIKELFPEAEKSISRFSKIAKSEDDFMQGEALKAVCSSNSAAEIALPLHEAILTRAVIIALKNLGIEKDWEKAHIDGVKALQHAQNGAKINLKKNVVAIKEYDKIVVFVENETVDFSIPFSIGKHSIDGHSVEIKPLNIDTDLKKGFKADLDKIPTDAVIRFKREGDKFTKFGGGTKSLGDYMTDKKIPLRLRNSIPLLAVGSEILVIFGFAVSNKIKVDQTTKNVIEFI